MNRELEMAKLACRALDEKKGKDIKVIGIHEVSVIADYFVIASASNRMFASHQNTSADIIACLQTVDPGDIVRPVLTFIK